MELPTISASLSTGCSWREGWGEKRRGKRGGEKREEKEGRRERNEEQKVEVSLLNTSAKKDG